MTVRFQSGVTAEALLLGLTSDRIRVVVAGRGTTDEWLMFDGNCFDEYGRFVQIESLIALDGGDYSALRRLSSRSATAGGLESVA